MAKMILAGAGEKMQYLMHEYNDNTIRFVLRYPGLIDPEILSAAVKALISQSDILHGSFINDALNAYWIIREAYDESCYFQYLRTAGDPYVTAQSMALLPILADAPTQLRCILVQSDEESAIALTVSHLCVDGGDGIYLLTKLAECYQLLSATGSADGFAIKSGNRAPEQIYEGLSPKELTSLLKVPNSDIKSEFPFPDENPGRKSLVSVTIPDTIMSAARRRAKADGATANDLLLAAMYRAYSTMPGMDPQTPASIMSMMDLRRHCADGQSEGLANLSGSFPTQLTEGIQGDFSQTLREIAAQTGPMKSDPLAGMGSLPLIHGAVRTMPMKLLLVIAGKVYGNFSLGLTNLGNLNCAALAMDRFAPTEGLFGGPLKKKPGMQISAASFDGNCTLSVVGEYTAKDAALLQQLLETMAAQITDYAKVQ